MFYAPHTLSVRSDSLATDDFGRMSNESRWLAVCPCRCDEASTRETDNDSERSFPKTYRIIADAEAAEMVAEGQEIIVYDLTGNVRAKGSVTQIKRLNALRYTEILCR